MNVLQISNRELNRKSPRTIMNYVSLMTGQRDSLCLLELRLSLRDVFCLTKSRKRRHSTVYPKIYAHGFCFAVLCCGYTLTDFPISIRLTSLALWQSNDCPSASKATLMNMVKYFMWIHYEGLYNHNKAKHNKTLCIFLGIYCMAWWRHGMETPSTLLIMCEGNTTFSYGSPHKWQVMWSFYK